VSSMLAMMVFTGKGRQQARVILHRSTGASCEKFERKHSLSALKHVVLRQSAPRTHNMTLRLPSACRHK
jgi:hypothetical protein